VDVSLPSGAWPIYVEIRLYGTTNTSADPWSPDLAFSLQNEEGSFEEIGVGYAEDYYKWCSYGPSEDYEFGIAYVSTDGALKLKLAYDGVGSFFALDKAKTWVDYSCLPPEPVPTDVTASFCGEVQLEWALPSCALFDYDLLIDGELVATHSGTCSLPVDLAGLGLASGQHTWQVVARGCNDQSSASEVGALNLVAPPAPATPVLVPTEDFDCDNGTLLLWGGGPDDLFDVILNGVVVATDLVDAEHFVGPSEISQAENTWQVIAKNCAGDTAASAEGSFAVTSDTAVVAPGLSSPGNNETLYCDGEFSWEGPGNPEDVHYRLYIYDASDMENPIREIVTWSTSHALTGEEQLPSGTYRWRIAAASCAGTEKLSGIRQFFVDNLPPSPVLDSPPQDQWAPILPLFSWTNVGAADDVVYDIYIDGSAAADSLAEAEFQLQEGSELFHGDHSWHVVATGCMDETSSSGEPRPFRVDATPPPPFDLFHPPDEADWRSHGEISFEWELTSEDEETGVGVADCTVYFDGLEYQSLPPATTSWTTLLPEVWGFEAGLDDWSFADGPNDWGLSSDAHSGQHSLTTNTDSYHDKFSTIVATLNYDWTVQTDKDLRFYIKGQIGLDSEFWLQTSPTGQGWQDLKMLFWSHGDWDLIQPDLSDFVGATVSFRFRFESGFLTSTGYRIDDFALGGGPLLGDGAHEWYVVCEDLFGNAQQSTTAGVLNIDNSPPVPASLISPLDGDIWNEPLPQFLWTDGADETSGVAGYEVWLDGSKVSGDELIAPGIGSWTPVLDLTEGDHTWKVAIVDQAANLSFSEDMEFLVDVTPPDEAVLVSPNGLTSDFQLCWEDAQDTGSGICNYEVVVDGETEYADIKPVDVRRDPVSGCVDFFNFYDDGAHQWYVIATDCAGNSTQSPLLDFVLETMPPLAFDALEPANGKTVNTLNPLFCWEEAVDLGTGVEYYELFVDDMVTPNQTIEGAIAEGVVCSWAEEPLTNGNHAWKVVAYDGAGNAKSGKGMPWGVTLTLDIYPPTTGVTVPLPGALAGCIDFEFQGTAGDFDPSGYRGSGVAVVEVQVDSTDGPWQQAQLTGTDYYQTWSYVWNGATGIHVLYVRAIDKKGNVQAPPTAHSFNVDCSGPQDFGLIAPDNIEFSGGCPTFVWEATDDSPAGMGYYELRVLNTDGDDELFWNVGLATSYPLTGEDCLTEGTYTWHVTAVDTLGNPTDSSSSRTLYIDQQGPVAFPLLSQSPVNPDGWGCNDGSIEVHWSLAGDAGPNGGVGMASKPYQVYLDGQPQWPRTSDTHHEFESLSDGSHTWSVRAYDALDNWTEATAVEPLGAFSIDCTGPALTESASVQLHAHHVPTYPGKHSGSPLDTGMDVEAGETLRIEVEGELCFADDASCDPDWADQGACMGPEGQWFFPYWVIATKYYEDIAFGKVVAIISGHQGEPIEIGAEAVFEAPFSGSLFVAANDNDVYNCKSRWHGVSVQKGPGFDLLFPPDGVISDETQPTLEWSPVLDVGIGVSRVEVVVNGEVVEGNLPPDATTFTLPLFAELTEQVNVWKVRAYDHLNNMTESSEWVIVTDLTPPEIFDVTLPIEGDVVQNKTPDLCWQGSSDIWSGIAHYLMFMDDEYNTSQYPDQTCQTPKKPLDEGEHCFYVVAQDVLRHERTSTHTRCFVVDTLPPEQFDLVAPAEGSVSFTAMPEFCWEVAADAGTGVQWYEIWLSGNHVATVPHPDVFPLPETLCWQATAPLANGAYAWYVKAVDGADAATQTVAWPLSVEKDITPPVVSIIEPAPDELFGVAGIQMVGTAVDGPTGTGVDKVVVFDTADPDSATVADFDAIAGEWTILWPVLANGESTLCAMGWDNEGNANTVPDGPHPYPCVQVRADVSPPLPFLVVGPADDAWTGARPTFAWQGTTDEPAGVTHYYLQIEGQPDYDAGTETEYELGPDQALPDGPYNWTVTVVDGLGNAQPALNTESFQVDGLQPGLTSLESPVNGEWLNTSNPQLCWAATQDNGGSGIAHYRVRIDGDTHLAQHPQTCYAPSEGLSQGTHVWDVGATDVAGNDGPVSLQRTFTLDLTPPPSPVATYPTDGMKVKDNPPQFSWLQVNDLPEGNASGICGYVVSVGGFEHVAAPSDNSMTWPVAVVDGQMNWFVKAFDCAGNHSLPSPTWTLMVDTVVPTEPEVVAPEDGTWLAASQPEISWLAATDDSGELCGYVVILDEVEIVLEPDALSFVPFNALAEGQHTYQVLSEDCASNRSSGETRWFGVDLSPPQAPSPQGPADGACLATQQPQLSWEPGSDSVSSLKNHLVTIDGDSLVEEIGPDEAWVLSPQLVEGGHVWTVSAEDLAGHTADGPEWSFVVDISKPSCSLGALAEADGGADQYTVSGSAADDGCGVGSVEIRVNGGDWMSVEGDPVTGWASWSFEAEIPDSAELTIECRSNDAAGNTSETVTYSAFLDACNTASSCDQVSFKCSAPVEDGSVCDDGDLCTKVDQCLVGECVGSPPVVCTAPDVCHVAGQCNTETGECGAAVPVEDGASCDADLNGCTVGDACSGGVCSPGKAADCSTTGDVCSVGACQSEGPSSYVCVKDLSLKEGDPCDDGNQNTTGDTCQGGQCLGDGCDCSGVNVCCDGCHILSVGGSCNADSNGCTKDDSCKNGVCVVGDPMDCTELDSVCIVGQCVSLGNNVHQCDKDLDTLAGQPCADGDFEGEGKLCMEGACIGEGCDCAEASICCDGCSSQAEGEPCDDKDSCTSEDSCESGFCHGIPFACDDGVECTVDYCDADLAECVSTPDDWECDDDNECTTDGCSPSDGCVASDVDEWTPCQATGLQAHACFGSICEPVPEGDTCESPIAVELELSVPIEDVTVFHLYRPVLDDCLAMPGQEADVFFSLPVATQGQFRLTATPSEGTDIAVVLWAACDGENDGCMFAVDAAGPGQEEVLESLEAEGVSSVYAQVVVVSGIDDRDPGHFTVLLESIIESVPESVEFAEEPPCCDVIEQDEIWADSSADADAGLSDLVGGTGVDAAVEGPFDALALIEHWGEADASPSTPPGNKGGGCQVRGSTEESFPLLLLFAICLAGLILMRNRQRRTEFLRAPGP